MLPEEPVAPVSPATLLAVPLAPGLPGVPVEPVEPVFPGVPAFPAAPGVPLVPLFPAVPGLPDAPELPLLPGVPALPEIVELLSIYRNVPPTQPVPVLNAGSEVDADPTVELIIAIRFSGYGGLPAAVYRFTLSVDESILTTLVGLGRKPKNIFVYLTSGRYEPKSRIPSENSVMISTAPTAVESTGAVCAVHL